MTVKISCRVILCRALPFGAMASLGSASLHAVGGILARSAAVRRGTRAVRASTYSTSVGPSADAKDYRVLAFEDSYSIKDMLADAKVRYGHFEQRWDSEACIDAIKEFGRVDVLMLDFYLPPLTGLQVLMKLNEAVEAGVTGTEGEEGVVVVVVVAEEEEKDQQGPIAMVPSPKGGV